MLEKSTHNAAEANEEIVINLDCYGSLLEHSYVLIPSLTPLLHNHFNLTYIISAAWDLISLPTHKLLLLPLWLTLAIIQLFSDLGQEADAAEN